MATSMKKWLGHRFDTVMEGKDEEWEKFIKDFRSFLKSNKNGLNLASFNKNWYECSGFFEKDGKYIYFSIPDVRYWQDEWATKILYRTAKDTKDFSGGMNMYSNIDRLFEDVDRLICR